MNDEELLQAIYRLNSKIDSVKNEIYFAKIKYVAGINLILTGLLFLGSVIFYTQTAPPFRGEIGLIIASLGFFIAFIGYRMV